MGWPVRGVARSECPDRFQCRSIAAIPLSTKLSPEGGEMLSLEAVVQHC